jgi:ASC-1-like (ASCH) protein
MRLNSPWFEQVRDGRKRYEGRRNTGKFTVGQSLSITNVQDPSQTLTAQIIAIHAYPSFEAALRELGLADVLPGVETLEAGIQIYQKYVSLATQQRDGVVMLELKVDRLDAVDAELLSNP